MRSSAIARTVIASVFLLFSCPAPVQQDGPRNFPVPETVATRAVDIWSAGMRMSTTVFTPKSADPASKLPTILLAHGWHGVAAVLTRDWFDRHRNRPDPDAAPVVAACVAAIAGSGI